MVGFISLISLICGVEQKGKVFWNGTDHVHSEPELLNLRSDKVEKIMHIAT